MPVFLAACAVLLCVMTLFFLAVALFRRKVAGKTVELAVNNRFLRQIIDSLPLAVYWKNTERQYLGCNRAFLSGCAGLSEEGLSGRTDEELHLMRADDSAETELQVMGSCRAVPERTEEQRSADGRRRWVVSDRLPLYDEKLAVCGFRDMQRYHGNKTERRGVESADRLSF